MTPLHGWGRHQRDDGKYACRQARCQAMHKAVRSCKAIGMSALADLYETTMPFPVMTGLGTVMRPRMTTVRCQSHQSHLKQ
jgi:hypothetical protein